MNPQKNTNPPVDIPDLSGYTLEQIRASLAACLPQLENNKGTPQIEAVSDAKGATEMAKTYKQRVRIGIDEDKTPIYKWATGHSIDELNDSVVRLYVEHGLIERFLHIDRTMKPAKDEIPTFREYANNWFETFKKPKLKPTTLQGYRSNMRKHLFPAFGDLRLDTITPETVQTFLNERADLAKNTVHTMFVLFSEIMDSAFEDRLIPSNPAKSKRISIPSTKKTERKALSPTQLKAIIREIAEKLTDETERRLISLMLFTGMRRGEILGLRWDDIDFEQKLITVNRAVSYTTNQPIVSTPKTSNGYRIVPLDPQLEEFLKPHREAGYVIGGERPPTQMVLRRILRHVNQQIDLFGATPHVFRHSYISALAEAGVDFRTIQRISGHSQMQTTIGYMHSRTDLVKQAGSQVGRMFKDAPEQPGKAPASA